MKKSLPWTAVALMLTGAVMLVADVGVAGLWIAVIIIGIAVVPSMPTAARGNNTSETPEFAVWWA